MNVLLLEYTNRAEELIAKAAKLCYSDSSIDDLIDRVDTQDVSAFVAKLMGMGHESPVEHVTFTFAVEGVSRVLSHQLVRHRIASYSQQSQRYVKLDKTFDYIIPDSIQASRPAYEEYIRLMEVVHNIYKALLDDGVPAEDARYVLPNATETKVVLTMNARTLLHFFNVRCCNRAQWEIRAMAEEMLIEAKKVAPRLFKGSGPSCVGGICKEGRMACGKMAEVQAKYVKMDDELGIKLDVTI